MTDLALQPAATAEPPAPAVSVAGLSKSIDERPILRSISFDVPRGVCTALFGANGAGKSTLMRILATLLTPSAGAIRVFGDKLGPGAANLRNRIGMIGHQAMLYRDLSARENLLFFGRLYGVANPRKRADELLEMVALADRADDPVRSFSRGMNQRVAIARALMHDPDLLLADEPFAGLDVPSSDALERLLRGLRDRGKTVILASHDVSQSLALAQRVLLLRRGQVALDRPASQVDAEGIRKELM